MMNPKVDIFLEEANQWQDELTQLRMIILDCGLTEELKWGHPCYTHNKKNVILLGGFKDFCTINFIKGVLLTDSENLLVQQGENSQSARAIKFTDVNQIIELEPAIKVYIFEAIEVEKAGLKVPYKKVKDFDIPDELTKKLEQDTAFKNAFNSLTPGRQKAYILHFSSAKQAKTRVDRIEKYTSRILKGKGIHDCVCGLSKRMPNCDGSHKQLEK